MSDGAEQPALPAGARPGARPRSGTTSPAALPFGGRNPLYAVVHEACYADGGATRWSAQRVLPAEFREDPTLLTGEHVFPWRSTTPRARAAGRGRRPARRARVAPALRRRGAAPLRRPGGRRDLRRRRLRRPRRSPRRPPPWCRRCGRGSPTSTSTTACAPTATGSSTGCSAWRAAGWREPGRREAHRRGLRRLR